VPFNTEPPQKIIATSVPLPDLGDEIDCGNFSLKITEWQLSGSVYFDLPPSGKYMIIYVDVTNKGDKTMMGFSPDAYLLKGYVEGEEYTYTIFPESRRNWGGLYWYRSITKPGLLGLNEPFYPGVVSKTFFLFDVDPKAQNLRLVTDKCESEISIGPNNPAVNRTAPLPTPDPVDPAITEKYVEIDYWNIDNVTSLSSNKKVILRGQIRDVLTPNSFTYDIAGTYYYADVTSTFPLDRIYSGESVTLYGSWFTDHFVVDHLEVTKVLR
jgi:hypothetical protein